MRGLAAAALAALAACGSGDGGAATPPPGKATGEACAARAECAAGLVCLSGACAASPPAAASCPAAPGTAPAPSLGDPVSSADPATCVSTVVGPVLANAADLGTLQVGSTATFEVPAGTSSIVLFSQEAGGTAPDTIAFGGSSVPNAVVPTDVRSPSGSLWYDDLAPWPGVRIGSYTYPEFTGLLALSLLPQPISGAFVIPNTSAALDRVLAAGGIEAGPWTFTVNDWARECTSTAGCTGGSDAGTYRVHAVTRGEPLASTGTLDLEVYLATDPEGALSTAQGAVSHPQISRWVRSVGHYLGAAGLCLGSVTFRDLPAWARSRYAPNGTVDVTDPGPCGDLQQLFTNATAPSRAVHLFLAEELVEAGAGGGFTVVGVDGSIPGPSGFPGTIYGGAILGLFGELGAGACEGAGPTLACGTDQLAYVAAHEIGHWLGLYHTTESTGTLFDPLSDTPRCPCYSCASTTARRNACTEVRGQAAATSVTNGDCAKSASCGGGRNLMFWLFSEGTSTGELSPDQGRVVRLNPAVR
jgi:hypothetical protein